ncbi:Uncharacterized protein OBRU01_07119 [Operophtera brumata]|uniref:Uncharacterized protein n=1 Tax=Operophtera brumata TaxID=104452 RepID=A0A0L7L494_OPEBR|nr:Uncharacterized protein OBRU01_07119 [Operophtera brumata]
MDESGIDMGYDLASLLTNDYNDQRILENMTAVQQHQDFMFYELKSKAVPITERTRGANFTEVLTLATMKAGFGKDPSYCHVDFR